MENVILIIHLILALGLIGVVLLQRSEGGGLGLGGGGGGAMSQRSTETALGKITWGLAIAFICTSITLTVVASRNSEGNSVLDRVIATQPDATAPAAATPVADPAAELLAPKAEDPASSSDGTTPSTD